MTVPLKKRILCVDDSGDDCDLYSFVLTEAGYEVESAQSFAHAVELIERGAFNLCLTDLSLADGTGFELLRRVRALNLLIPVVVCSGDSRGSTRQEAMAAGAEAFFTKPVDLEPLLETITRLIS